MRTTPPVAASVTASAVTAKTVTASAVTAKTVTASAATANSVTASAVTWPLLVVVIALVVAACLWGLFRRGSMSDRSRSDDC